MQKMYPKENNAPCILPDITVLFFIAVKGLRKFDLSYTESNESKKV